MIDENDLKNERMLSLTHVTDVTHLIITIDSNEC